MGSLRVSGRPQDPSASRLPCASSQSAPRPTAGRVLTYIWERPGGQRAARPQEPQGPEQRQPHGSGAWGRARAAGAGRSAEEPRLPGLLRSPSGSAQPPGPAPPPPTRPRARLRPRKAPPPQRAGSQRGVDLAHDSDSRRASADLHSGFPATVQNGSRGPVRPAW